MKDQVVLIVGGSGGIGHACAELFCKAGAKVVLAARNREKAEEKAKSIKKRGSEVHVIEVDVTNLASVSDMAREIDEKFGGIDVLVNAFGTGIIQPLLDIKPDDAKELFDVNVFGTFLVTQTVVRYMAAAKKGSVIMFPGILGKSVMRNTSVYSASKYAVTGFTKALVEENKRSGIKFSLLYLGGVATDFWENPKVELRVQKEKMLTAAEVAKAVYYAASQPGQSVLNELVLQPESHQMV
ncbi:MAG: SDR family oxidoreductase [Balneolaceae bacterium]|nr:SDR family oxidoreductase [Balneolaceae bacterium]